MSGRDKKYHWRRQEGSQCQTLATGKALSSCVPKPARQADPSVVVVQKFLTTDTRIHLGTKRERVLCIPSHTMRWRIHNWLVMLCCVGPNVVFSTLGAVPEPGAYKIDIVAVASCGVVVQHRLVFVGRRRCGRGRETTFLI